MVEEIDASDQIIKVRYHFSYDGACPKSIQPPTPTPKYSPMCQHTARLPDDPSRGIKVQLYDLNGGPGGIMFPIEINNQSHFLFYQPCERVPCPARKCDVEYSSVWLCDSTVSICDDYGVANENQEIDTNPTNFSKPVVISLNGATFDTFTHVFAACDTSFFPNRIEFDHASKSLDNGIELSIRSPAVCVQQIPPPIPDDPSHCYFGKYESGINVSFNASLLDIQGGYVTNVNTTGMVAPIERKLYFQPCSGLYCPPDADCDNYEDAYIWLCKDIYRMPENEINESSKKKDVFTTDTQICYTYGLFENNISISQITSYLPDGVRISYKGNDNYNAEVDFICDYNLEPGTIKFPSVVTTTHSGQSLQMEIRSRDSCPLGTPIPPPPPFYPTIPTKGITPTPIPNPNPNPLLTLYNDTHYVMFNLSSMSQSVRDSHIVLSSQGQTRDIQVSIEPFGQSECPWGYDCGEFDKATIWSCWIDAREHPVCFPIGDSSEGIEIKGISGESDFERGVFLYYIGHYNVNTELRVNCDRQQSKIDYFPLDPNAGYQVWVNTEYGLNSSSSLSCPVEFRKPVIPVVVSPTPPPNPNDESRNLEKFISTFVVGNKKIDINLKAIHTIKQNVIAGMSGNYERAQFILNFAQRESCPEDYQCGNYDPSNIWKCDINRSCIPVGDVRFGFNVQLIDPSTLIKGVVAEFSGGLGDYKTRVSFLCDFNLNTSEYLMANVVRLSEEKKEIGIVIRTSSICPRDFSYIIRPITWGAIFNIVFSTLFVGYFAGCVIFKFVSDNEIALPNDAFWYEFFTCVKTSFLYLFPCGKFRTDSYQNID